MHIWICVCIYYLDVLVFLERCSILGFIFVERYTSFRVYLVVWYLTVWMCWSLYCLLDVLLFGYVG